MKRLIRATIAILACGIFTLEASASVLSDACVRYLESVFPSTDSMDLSKRMTYATFEVGLLARDARYIQSLISENEGPTGDNNAGIFRVQTADGTKIMKVIPENYEPEEARYQFVIQNFLSERGIAPRIWAVLPHEEVARLPFMHDREHSYAVVMDDIRGAWNLSRDKTIPEEILSWPQEEIFKQIRNIEGALKRFGIVPQDPQLAISKDGHVFLIDISEYSWVSLDGVSYDFDEYLGVSIKKRYRKFNLLRASFYSLASPAIRIYLDAYKKKSREAKSRQ